MLLHQNIKEFRKIVILTATHYGLQEYQIEKDYYISLFLKPLGNMSKNIPIVFKGGTSLSKCYGVISRFSEDIDLSVIQNKQLTRKQKKDLKQLIIETAKEIGADGNDHLTQVRADFELITTMVYEPSETYPEGYTQVGKLSGFLDMKPKFNEEFTITLPDFSDYEEGIIFE
jgi:hypothetical protein